MKKVAKHSFNKTTEIQNLKNNKRIGSTEY